MQVNFFELFGLKKNFTKEELKNGLMAKINMIEKLGITPIDKKFLLEQYYEQYNLAKSYLAKSYPIKNQLMITPEEHFSSIHNSYNHMIRQFQQLNTSFTDLENKPDVKSNVFTQSYSYQSVLNPDGTRTVLESKNKVDNGKSDRKTNSYIIDSQGNKKPIQLDEAKKYIGYKK